MLSMEPEVTSPTNMSFLQPGEHQVPSGVLSPTKLNLLPSPPVAPPTQTTETTTEARPLETTFSTGAAALNTGEKAVVNVSENVSEEAAVVKPQPKDFGAESTDHPDPAAGVESKSPALVKEQLKFCANVLRGLKRHPQSPPFQHPVDPVALNIPDYFNIIKYPMDLSTISKKMEANEYRDAESFVANVRLMLQNCFTYNHPDSQVAKMGHSLEKYFNTQLGKMPTTLPTPGSHPTEDRRKSEGTAIATPLAASRARRESHAPARHTPTASTTTPRPRSRSVANPEMAFCNNILRELLKKSHQAVTWPFLEPVDPAKLGIPDYFDVIKHPMDLSTIRRKLDTNQYKTAEQFEADIRLIISNCYSYNAPDSDVVGICRGFEKLFNSKWAQKPSHFGASAASGGATHHHHHRQEDDEDSDSEKILEINRQIQALQQELNHLLMKRKHRSSTSTGSGASRPKKAKTATTATTLTNNAPAPPRATPVTEEEFLNTPMTFEEKRELSVQVNNLPPEKLGRVVEIIQSGMALEAQGDSDVIELDIESLNIRTLRQLQRYVMECQGITSLTAILKMGSKKAQTGRKKPTSASSNATAASGATSKKHSENAGMSLASAHGGGGASNETSTAAAAAVAAMSSEEETSDDDLD